MTELRTSEEGADGRGAEGNRLRGHLGVWAIVLIVAAAASPLGVMGGTIPIGIAVGNGVAFPATFVACSIILLLFAAGFTALTPFVPNAGAFYSYIGKGLGRQIGFGAAFVALFAYMAEVIAVYGLLGAGADNLFSSYGLHVHWLIWALIALAFTAFLGHRNIDLSKRVLGVLLVLEVIIVLALDAAVFAAGGDSGISTAWLQPGEFMSGAPGLAILFAFLSFLGFEATAVFRDEARDPDKTIPRATYLAVTLIGIFYVVSTWALITAWGDEGALKIAATDSTAMLPEATQRYLGTAAEHIVLVLFVSSLFACVLSFHNIVARYAFTLANRNAMPAKLGEVHGRHGAPSVASGVASGIAVVFLLGAAVVGLDPVDQLYTWFAGTTTVGFILLLIGTTAAVLVFFYKQWLRGELAYSVGRVFISPFLGLVSLLVVFWLVLKNLPGLVGDSTTIAFGVIGLLLLAFGAGVVLAISKPNVTMHD